MATPLLFFFFAFTPWKSAGSESSHRCYSCTTPDAASTLREVQDNDWQRWLNNVQSVPRSPHCSDPFRHDSALKQGAVLEECPRGVCMKMWFRERKGSIHIWRTCIPKGQGIIRSDCTKITSSEGDMEVCTCDGNACNRAGITQRHMWAGTLCTVIAFLILYDYYD